MLTNAETLAVTKAIASKVEKEARAELQPGKYEIDALVRVFGSLTVGEDYEQNKTAAMPQVKMLLAAIMLNGISVKAFVRKYLDGEFQVDAEKEAELKEVWQELADSFKAEFKGKVTSKLTVEKAGDTAEAAA